MRFRRSTRCSDARARRPRRRRPARARGMPDQTYDTWPMTGPSAYGGTLWLGRCAAPRRWPAVGDGRPRRWRRSTAARTHSTRLWRGGYYAYDDGGATAATASWPTTRRPVVRRRDRARRPVPGGPCPGGPPHHPRAQRRRFGDGLMGAVNGSAATERSTGRASSRRRSGSGPPTRSRR